MKTIYLLVLIQTLFMSDSRKRHEALLYHAKPKPGKIAVVPTKKYATQHDLALRILPEWPSLV